MAQELLDFANVDTGIELSKHPKFDQQRPIRIGFKLCRIETGDGS
jgi:hypothetical protein